MQQKTNERIGDYAMDEQYIKELTENTERTKSNTHQIQEIKEEIKDIREEQKAIYKIASSVEIIANNMQNLKEGLEEVKYGQEKLGQKMDDQIVEVRNEQKNLDIKIDAVDNKTKIDTAKSITKIINDNWYKWAFGVGGISGVVYFMSQLIK
jgi:maltodextrin utilization protein YvdJ